jgi:CheY-like chemotaxis protein
MLNGTNVLVVEEEFLIALDIQRMLETMQSGQILFARTVEEAISLHSHWADVGLAIVEVALEQDGSLALVDKLILSGIPIVLCTADAALRRGIAQYPRLPVVTKPMAETDLVHAIGQVFNPRS